MHRRVARFVAVGTWATASACAARPSRPTSTTEGSRDPAAIVIRGDELPSNLLDGLRNRIPAMTISYAGVDCPRIMFRGQKSARAQENPSVYLDGTRMRDTCVLTAINPTDVHFVEVLPGGHSGRPGIQSNPFGLILVFRNKD